MAKWTDNDLATLRSAARADGATVRSIADVVGRTMSSIRSKLIELKINVVNAQSDFSGERARVTIPPDVLALLKSAAAFRRMSVRRLASKILVAASTAGLIDAVLDDLGDADRKKAEKRARALAARREKRAAPVTGNNPSEPSPPLPTRIEVMLDAPRSVPLSALQPELRAEMV